LPAPADRSWLDRHALGVALLLIALATARIALTYHVFSHTLDEPTTLAAGMEWLDRHTYDLEPHHPPLARVMSALGPYLTGERSQGHRHIFPEGYAILFARGHYERVLALARAGILPFFWIAALSVYAWSRRAFGAAEAVMAVFLFTQLPAILAHAGQATTDLAVTAFVGTTVAAALAWSARPSPRRALTAGAFLGLAVLSKFSALVFIPASLVAMLAWYLLAERPSSATLRALTVSRLHLLPLALAAAALVVWAGYRFSYGPVSPAGIRLPAPELFEGIRHVVDHNRSGHISYLLGERRQTGWWYFFPLALAVKTPLAFLALALGGAVVAVRQATAARWPLACSAAVLLCALPSRINLGTRHVLAIYVGLSIVAAVFAVDRLRSWPTRPATAGAVVVLILWLTASVSISHPDYLSYFNAAAGREPERILVDSDLDWLQDLRRLARRLREVGASEVAFLLPSFGPPERQAARALFDHLGFPPVRDLDPLAPSPGWHAVSLTFLKTLRLGLPEGERRAPWPERVKPTERVGHGIYLYDFPPAERR
jgi:4-amino-4-deoxy-L-arabinose transferase-like glycosyltransferase